MRQPNGRPWLETPVGGRASVVGLAGLKGPTSNPLFLNAGNGLMRRIVTQGCDDRRALACRPESPALRTDPEVRGERADRGDPRPEGEQNFYRGCPRPSGALFR
jgi:hypothetical protein